MSDNLFTQEETNQEVETPQAPQAPEGGEPNPAQTAPVTDPYANQLAGIVAEDGRQKYVDVHTALNSIPHAQSHIAELTRKNAELEAEVNKRAGMEQVLERIDQSTPNTEQPSVTGLSEERALELMDARHAQRENAASATANEMAVTNGLVEKFGTREKAFEAMQAKATELGVDMQFLQSVSQQSPAAALAYFSTASAPTGNPTTPGNTTPTLPQGNETEDRAANAKAKLFGETDPLRTKWRAAAQTK